MCKRLIDRRYAVLIHPSVSLSSSIDALRSLGLRTSSSLKPLSTIPGSKFHDYVGNDTVLWLAHERWYKLYAIENVIWFRDNIQNSSPNKKGNKEETLKERNSVNEGSTGCTDMSGIDRNLVDLCYSFQALPIDQKNSEQNVKRNFCTIPTTDIILVCNQKDTSALCELIKKRSPLPNESTDNDESGTSKLDYRSNYAFPLDIHTWIVSLSPSNGENQIIHLLSSYVPESESPYVKNWLGSTD